MAWVTCLPEEWSGAGTTEPYELRLGKIVPLHFLRRLKNTSNQMQRKRIKNNKNVKLKKRDQRASERETEREDSGHPEYVKVKSSSFIKN